MENFETELRELEREAEQLAAVFEQVFSFTETIDLSRVSVSSQIILDSIFDPLRRYLSQFLLPKILEEQRKNRDPVSSASMIISSYSIIEGRIKYLCTVLKREFSVSKAEELRQILHRELIEGGGLRRAMEAVCGGLFVSHMRGRVPDSCVGLRWEAVDFDRPELPTIFAASAGLLELEGPEVACAFLPAAIETRAFGEALLERRTEGFAGIAESFQMAVEGFFGRLFEIRRDPASRRKAEAAMIELRMVLKRGFLAGWARGALRVVEESEACPEIPKELASFLSPGDSLEEVSSALKAQIEREMLRNSVATASLLGFYVRLLRFWSKIGLSMQLVPKLTGPVKKYLLKREDALRCIIELWISEIEAAKGDGRKSANFLNVPVAEEITIKSEDEEEDSDFEIAITGSRRHSKTKFKKSDVKTLLVDLYGSKETFLKEYENYLAEKILHFKHVDVSDEQKNLNLLKQNMKNSSNLSRCNILMNDVEVSRQLTQGFNNNQLSFLIVSKSFWPVNYDAESFALEALPVNGVLQEFLGFYKQKEAGKTLLFHPNLGQVELELLLNSRKLDVSCQPIHAAIITEITTNDGIELSVLASKLQADPEYIKGKVGFWTRAGVVIEERDKDNAESIRFRQNHAYDGDTNVLSCNEPNEYLLGEKVKSQELEASAGKIEELIIQILRSSGAKTLSKLVDLMKSVYKNDIPRGFSDKFMAKILRKLVKQKSVVLKDELYSVEG